MSKFTEKEVIGLSEVGLGLDDLVRQGAAKSGFTTRDIVSGAAHDAVYAARHVPTAMIFTPCKDGLSHNEAESIEPGEAEAGCQVLPNVSAMLR